MSDVLRERIFKAAMKHNNDVAVLSMLELGHDAFEEAIIDSEHLECPVSPLYRALSLRQFSLARTIISHLSQGDDEIRREAVLQHITDKPEKRGWSRTDDFTLDQWSDLMRIPIVMGASPTVQCFKVAVTDEIERLLTARHPMEWLKKGLLKSALRNFDEPWRAWRAYEDYTGNRIRRVVEFVLGDSFKHIDKSLSEVHDALAEAMEAALDYRQSWAVELIHFAGLQLQPPLTSKTYTIISKETINDLCWTKEDWDTLWQLLDTEKKRPLPSRGDEGSRDFVTGLIYAKTQEDFDNALRMTNLHQVDNPRHLQYVWNKGAKLGRDDVAIAAIRAWKDHPRIRENQVNDGMLALLRYVRVAAISTLIMSDDRFSQALRPTRPSGDFRDLDNLLHRSNSSGKQRALPEFVSLSNRWNLQIALRALAYHAFHTCDHGLLEWLISVGLDTDGLCYEFSDSEYDDLDYSLAELGLNVGTAGKRSKVLGRFSTTDRKYLPSLLSIAAQRKNPEMIQTLIRSGADPLDSDALREAVEVRADPQIIQLLLSAAGNGSKRQYGVGAMREAIRQRNPTLVKRLANYVDINGMETSGRHDYDALSPLGEAIQCRDCDSAQFLINQGADIGALVTWQGMKGSNLERLTPLLAAIVMDDVAMVILLANAGANLDQETGFGLLRTPLQSAAELHRTDIVRFLLSKNVPVDSTPFYSGGTPLQIAAISGFTGVAQLLLEHGANVNHPPAEGDGRTAFEGAAEWGRIDMMTLLVRWGADLDLMSRPKPISKDHGTDVGSARMDQDNTDVADDEVYGTQYERALIFAERRGNMASKRFVQHLRSAIDASMSHPLDVTIDAF